MVHVKFCGIRRPEDTEAVNRLKPDLAGFVFAKSKRQISREQAAGLKKQLDPKIKTVAVLVNMPAEEAAALANSGIADLLQLHGDEDAVYIAALRKRTRAKIIKAIRLQGTEVDNTLMKEAQQTDFYLFDTFVPDAYGGTGKTFSLSLLKGVRIEKPFFLAGGLDADNVAGIIGQVQKDTTLLPNFYGVDVSGGIETDGYKDAIKMEAFMKAIRG
ncbi:MAG: phosphoribosylanthranilate isomerase [Acidaminococcaceae bacterium]|nr:phosphoribosylanthranilate isomerase [Acidaminococcaceae bacterium]MBQ6913118.1 phosphoribosylanthranilate isomerase [Acidaminococcaceae bacterium]